MCTDIIVVAYITEHHTLVVQLCNTEIHDFQKTPD